VPSPVDGDFERPCNPLIRDRPKGEGTCPRCVLSAAEFPDTLKQELGNERPKEEKMAVDRLAAILAFFGVDPKKVPLLLPRPFEFFPPAGPLTSGHSPARGKGTRI
jgi:hypothetical protein